MAGGSKVFAPVSYSEYPIAFVPQGGPINSRSGSDRNGRFRMFSSIRSFTWICGLLGLVQTMSFTYWIPTLSTFEKRFRIPSRTVEHVSALGRHLQLYCDYPQSLMLQTASKSRNMFYENKKQEATEIRWMLSGNEISQILLSLLLTYYGGQRNRPLWIAWGVAFSAASCYLLALPHFIYGPGQAALSIIKENTSDYGTTNNLSTSYKRNLGLCTRNEEEEDGCGDGDVGVEDEATLVAPILVFVSQFILGVGSSLYFTLGQTYIDDNIKKKKNSPFLLGLTLALKTIGPAFGFLLGNICLKIFVDPTLSPPISSRENPK
ncbi:hypothetical protein AAG570_002358 [Ranatra chinensis]|uniref:Uncharacterized protein n=1 Tax=Ranatra chinensis TaxID=642074 RepID=A0ABD0Y7Q5_9HEMI